MKKSNFFIDKWWWNYFGGTDDSITLMDYFQKDDITDYPLSKIFDDFNLQSQIDFGNARDTKDIHFFDDDNIHYHHIIFVIDLITNLIVITLESLHNKVVNIKDLHSCSKSNKIFTIIITSKEWDYMMFVLDDFIENAIKYDLAELCPKEDMIEMSEHCKEIKEELKKYRNIKQYPFINDDKL